jgi:hypothetical protein
MANCNCKSVPNGGKGGCVECDISQMSRNNYFTGKLLVERDFTDEQRYTMGKLRRHNQRLHGWGAVCGLKVKQHPNPGCQGRYVLIEPGTAIDCCGREILVPQEEYFDFEARFLANWQKQNGPSSQPDPKQTHPIQICVSYNECPTEDVPALFDDCSCDATSCLPNRILENYCFDVVIDPKSSTSDARNVELKWWNTLNITDVVRVAEDRENNRLYVLTSVTSAETSTASLYVFDDKYTQLPPPFVFTNSTGLDLAVAPNGDFLYVATQPTTPLSSPPLAVGSPPPAAGSPPQINVFSTVGAGGLTAMVQQFPVGTTSDPTLRIVIIPGQEGSLVTFGQTVGLMVWSGVNTVSPAPSPTSVTGIAGPVAVAIGGNGEYAYVATMGSTNINAVALATPLASSVTTISLTTSPSSLAIATTTDGDILAALDTTPASSMLYFVKIPPAGPISATVLPKQAKGFAYAPTAVLMSPEGHWTYVLEKDSTTRALAYVQVVNEHTVEAGQPNYLGTPLAVGSGPVNETLSQDGTHLYVPYVDPTDNANGAVAIVEVLQTDCGDLFHQAIEHCPDCKSGNCIVLATIADYKYTNPITDSDIDNLVDRRLLVSTDVLTHVVGCMLDQGAASGKSGPQGIPGPAGPGITDVHVQFVPCSEPGGATLSGTAPDLTLNLTIPGPCNPDLVVIQTISWEHNGNVPISTLLNPNKGLSIAFSGGVISSDLSLDTVSLLIPVLNNPLQAWAEADVGITVKGGIFATIGDVNSAFTGGPDANGLANGLQLTIDQVYEPVLKKLLKRKIRVCVRGDFIRDSNNQGLDADNLPLWVPKNPVPGRVSGDGIEGGTFESWFTLLG